MEGHEIELRESSQLLASRREATKHVKKRLGAGGQELSYLEHGYVTRALNEVFGLNWGYQVVVEPKVRTLPPLRKTVNGREVLTEQEEVIIWLRFLPSANNQQPRDSFGSAIYYPKNPNASYGDALKAAMSDALKVAVYRYGDALGLFLYEKSEREAVEADLKREQSMAKPATITLIKQLAKEACIDDLGHISEDITNVEATRLIVELRNKIKEKKEKQNARG